MVLITLSSEAWSKHAGTGVHTAVENVTCSMIQRYSGVMQQSFGLLSNAGLWMITGCRNRYHTSQICKQRVDDSALSEERNHTWLDRRILCSGMCTFYCPRCNRYRVPQMGFESTKIKQGKLVAIEVCFVPRIQLSSLAGLSQTPTRSCKLQCKLIETTNRQTSGRNLKSASVFFRVLRRAPPHDAQVHLTNN